MQIGVSKIPITPQVPVNMGGYGARKGPSVGVHDDLYARTFVFEQGGTLVALVTADLPGLSLAQISKIREMIQALTDIPPENTIIASSHTHSGPLTVGSPGGPQPSDTYTAWLLEALAGSVKIARENMTSALAAGASGEVQGVGANRRREGGPTDDSLRVLGFAGEEGKLLAVVVNYQCHPTVLGPANRRISADYPGAALWAVNCVLGDDVVVGFVNGACGDVSTRFTRRNQSFAEVKRLGTILAGGVLGLVGNLKFKEVNRLTVESSRFEIQLKEFGTAQDLERQRKEAESEVQRLKAQGAHHGDLRVAETALQGIERMLLYTRISDFLEREAYMTAIGFDDSGLVSVPGELFSSLGKKIRGESPFSTTLIVGYANGHFGYIPDLEAYEGAGYEVFSSYLKEGTGEEIAARAGRHLQTLK